jgi:hypothetical protein
MSYQEMSRDEAGSILFRSPAQPQMAPAEPAPIAAQAAPIAPQPAGQRPTPVKASGSAPAAIDTDSMATDVAATARQMQKEGPKPELISPFDPLIEMVTSNWKPLAIGAGVAAAGIVGSSMLSRRMKKKKDAETPVEKIDPTFNPPDNPPPPPPAPAAPAGEQRLNLQDVIERTKAVNAPVAPPAPGGPTYNVPTAAVPQIGVQAPAPATVQAPMGAAAPAPVIPTVTEAVVTGESPAQAIKADLAQQIDNTPAGAVAPKKGRPAGAKNLTPEERLARKGVLPGMTPEQASMRNYLLGTYGGKENPAALQAYEIVKDILGYPPAYPPGSKGGGLAPEETGKILQYRKENIPGPKVNLTRDMKTVLKRGGPAAVAALVLTPEFAKASTEEQRQLIGEALTPMAMTPTTAEAPGVPESRFEQSALLGSPYAQTEWAKEKRKAIKGAAIPR